MVQEGQRLTFGDLYAGVGGWSEGLRRAGLECRWQIEKARRCHRVLDERFPGVDRRFRLAEEFPPIYEEGWYEAYHVDVICGGDPCPHRSRARKVHGTRQPDMWPHFLRIVSELRPLWVLREHVVSPDADECAGMLHDLGYRVVVVDMDAAQVTGQSRPREYLCGVLASAGVCPSAVLSQREGHPRSAQAVHQAMPIARCLTTHPQRFDSRDNYILDPGRGLRILDGVERERLMGFPDGWTGGLAPRGRAAVTGNAVVVQQAEWFGRRLIEFNAAPVAANA